MIIGIGNFIGNTSGGERWYVRPAGETYGLGDGTSYDNAWAGFSEIVWGSISDGATLYVAGTHTETLTVGKSSVTIESLIADPATIDNAEINSGVVCIDLTNVTINSFTVENVLVNGFYFEDSTGIVTNDCVATGTGNQGFQHIGAVTATHNNPTCTDNVDDGISVHDSGVIIVNGGTFDGNDHQINIIATAQLTINGSPTFTGTSTYDLYVTNATSAESSVITMNGGTVRNINSDIDGKIILNGVTVSGTTSISASVGSAYLEATDSIFIGNFTNATGGLVTLTSCYVEVVASFLGSFTLSKCHVVDDLALGATGILIAEHTYFDGTGTSAALVDVNSGSLAQIKYCLFKNMATTAFGVSFRTGANASSYVNNCLFIGTANAGRGTFSQIDITLNNNIYYDLAIGHFRSAEDQTLNNCCFFDCTTAKSGTNITSNNEVTTDPLFVNAGADDYSLAGGSPCLGTGSDLGDTYDGGIDSAEWGDADTVPVVTTGIQGENWNIGAYI